MTFSDYSIIISGVAFVLFFSMLIMSRVYQKRRKLGKMKPKRQMEMASGEMLYELRSKYTYWKMVTIKILESIDKYIEEKLSIYPNDSLINDEEMIFKLGSFTGEVLKYTKKYHWRIDND